MVKIFTIDDSHFSKSVQCANFLAPFIIRATNKARGSMPTDDRKNRSLSINLTAADMGAAEPSEGVLSPRALRSFTRTASAAEADYNFVSLIQRRPSVEMYENFVGLAVSQPPARRARERSGLSRASHEQAVAGDPSDEDCAARAASKMIKTLRSGKRNTANAKICSPLPGSPVTANGNASQAAGSRPRRSSVVLQGERFTPYPFKRGGSDKDVRASLSLPSAASAHLMWNDF